MTELPSRRRRVVIAEDEALIRLDLAEMLAEEGYDVVGQAGDGEQAVELAEELRPDLVDPRRQDAASWTASRRPSGSPAQRIAPVVILTAFSQRDLVERARDAGAMAYLVKPFAKTDLVPAIEMAVAGSPSSQQLEPEVADLTERLETRKLVDRAKGDPAEAARPVSEPEAFRWIQKTAMDLRLSMREVAEGVVTHGPGSMSPTMSNDVRHRRRSRNDNETCRMPRFRLLGFSTRFTPSMRRRFRLGRNLPPDTEGP